MYKNDIKKQYTQNIAEFLFLFEIIGIMNFFREKSALIDNDIFWH